MIHKGAYIDPKAEIGQNVSIGPNCYVGPGVVLGDNCVLRNNVTVTGNTTCGKGNEFFPGVVIGVPPQDLKYKGGETRVEIGEDNIFRENVTVHAGTEISEQVTRIGSHNRFLVGTHIAHDVFIGNDCILSNYVQLAGHVYIEDKVTMGGIIGVHHFTTLGKLSYIGGLTRVVADVPPFMIVEGNPSRIRGFNEVGMRRWGYDQEQIKGVRDAYRILFSPRGEEHGSSLVDRLMTLEKRPDVNGDVRYLCESVRRSLQDGIFGRQREVRRQDTDEDRRSYYKNNISNKED
ncbi:MAG: acyl-ACP--UDP-N-acetylglucosamine O-acyltransferase [Planctomycetota bacterium]|nr:MAG: acyl-ACP--UDP-N-acetylglucosamine O-acyltransferase [Planctomycetota bacterium]